MENVDKGLTLPKRVLIIWPKIPQIPQEFPTEFVGNLSVQAQRFGIFVKKTLCVSVVLDFVLELNSCLENGS